MSEARSYRWRAVLRIPRPPDKGRNHWLEWRNALRFGMVSLCWPWRENRAGAAFREPWKAVAMIASFVTTKLTVRW